MFNLFYHRYEPTIICALPDGAALPSFLRDAWKYQGKVEEIRSQQLEFDKSSIDAVVRQNGFYVYTRMSSAANSSAAEKHVHEPIR